jgi:hypothetical protein
MMDRPAFINAAVPAAAALLLRELARRSAHHTSVEALRVRLSVRTNRHVSGNKRKMPGSGIVSTAWHLAGL